MMTRTKALLAMVALAAACSERSPLAVRDGAVDSTIEQAQDGSHVSGNGGTPMGTGGGLGNGGTPGSGGAAVGTGGGLGSGGSLAASGGRAVGTGGRGAGGEPTCLGPSPLGAGVGGGACEGGSRCTTVKSATLGYETCSWLVTRGRESVFEALRSCFAEDPAFCSNQPASVEACTSAVFARACPGPGATVDGKQVDCGTLAADCPGMSEPECHRLTDVLNDKYYQAAFECYFRQSPRPADCGAALRACTGVPMSGTGGIMSGTGGTVSPPPGTGGAGGAGGTMPRVDGGAPPLCPGIAGTWRVEATCQGPGAFFDGAFTAIISQTDCSITFTQTDEQSSTQWVSKGTLDVTGKGSLAGEFGFTDSRMCDLQASAAAWTGHCGSATQACELVAERSPP